MKFFLDTEFNEDGRTIDLISIAVVCENGAEFYRQNCQADWRRFNPWVQSNVEPQLWRCPKNIPGPRHTYGPCADPNCVWQTSRAIANGLQSFVVEHTNGVSLPEFWGEDCAYDFVVVSQLLGGINGTPGWPKAWPYFFYDIDAVAHMFSLELQPVPGTNAHNALTDARWIREQWMQMVRTEEVLETLYAGKRDEQGVPAREVDQESGHVRSAETRGQRQVNGSGDQQRSLQQNRKAR